MRFRADGSSHSNVESVWGGRSASGDPPRPRAKAAGAGGSVDMTRYSGAFPGKAYPFETHIKASKASCIHFWGDRENEPGG
jgi:hypothetical protein